jgi:catechol 2,3-dioxygenase-like lactoylglutathione lyase family enzyme
VIKVKIHHTGIIVDSIEKSIAIYNQLGYKQTTEIFLDEIQYVRVVFLISDDLTQTIELIESRGDMSAIHNFKKGLHHICYDTSDVQDYVEYFKALKIGKIFTKPIVAPAINNRFVVFALLNNGIFIELIL